jgi:hypothetical protein
VKRSAEALQRKHVRSAEALSAADFKICSTLCYSAKRAALHFEKSAHS